ncbi:MAG: PKD domain-containing protein [Patescibacteria group bacterium]|nr:PKD domain-containing protein [Patescibacteria group bacterium]
MSSLVTITSNEGLVGEITVDGGANVTIGPQTNLPGIQNNGSGLVHITGSSTSVDLSDGAYIQVDSGNLTIEGTINWSNNSQTELSAGGNTVAHFGYSQGAGHTLNFTEDSFFGAGLSASTRAWGFGDSGTSTAANPSHTYSAAGTYTVTFTLTDNASNVSVCTLSVTTT